MPASSEATARDTPTTASAVGEMNGEPDGAGNPGLGTSCTGGDDSYQDGAPDLPPWSRPQPRGPARRWRASQSFPLQVQGDRHRPEGKLRAGEERPLISERSLRHRLIRGKRRRIGKGDGGKGLGVTRKSLDIQSLRPCPRSKKERTAGASAGIFVRGSRRRGPGVPGQPHVHASKQAGRSRRVDHSFCSPRRRLRRDQDRDAASEVRRNGRDDDIRYPLRARACIDRGSSRRRALLLPTPREMGTACHRVWARSRARTDHAAWTRDCDCRRLR